MANDSKGTGQLVRGFHGDPSRGNQFWEYPRHRRLVTARWDTYNARRFCLNRERVGPVGGGVVAWRCLGHDPTSARVDKILELGFSLDAAKTALSRTYDDLESAIAWLLNQGQDAGEKDSTVLKAHKPGMKR